MGDTRSLRFAAFAAIAALAGCAETQLGAQLAKDVAREDAPAAATQRELAPESFEANGLTIWDGQTTLQGIWVAHPLAQKAQRVRVINSENGLEVEGAMFRRDPTLSGPSILVSSDAARGLGLQPGRPTELPGSRPIEFEPELGEDLGRLREWARENVVKLLVFCHPDDDDNYALAGNFLASFAA